MTEFEKGRICPRTKKWCPDCTHTCRIEGLIAWVQDISPGNDAFGKELTDKEIEDSLNKLNPPAPDPIDDENLGPFKDKFGEFFEP